MKNFCCQQRAFAFMEYLVMIIVIITALMAFRFYVQRGYQGQMARAGETFAFGRQYNPKDTFVCMYDNKKNVWFSEACYKQALAVSGDRSREAREAAMDACKAPCASYSK